MLSWLFLKTVEIKPTCGALSHTIIDQSFRPLCSIIWCQNCLLTRRHFQSTICSCSFLHQNDAHCKTGKSLRRNSRVQILCYVPQIVTAVSYQNHHSASGSWAFSMPGQARPAPPTKNCKYRNKWNTALCLLDRISASCTYSMFNEALRVACNHMAYYANPGQEGYSFSHKKERLRSLQAMSFNLQELHEICKGLSKGTQVLCSI